MGNECQSEISYLYNFGRNFGAVQVYTYMQGTSNTPQSKVSFRHFRNISGF